MISVGTAALDLALAVVLFFLMNWVGGHAVLTQRYFQLSYFAANDEAPAFNIVFRCLAPVVYLVLVTTAMYAVGLDSYVRGIYWVVLLQIAGRWMYNLLWGRRLLLRWKRQAAVATITVALTMATYSELLFDRRRLLPNPVELRDQLWIVVLLFLYKLWDSAGKTRAGDDNQRTRYIEARYRSLRTQFGEIISEEACEPETQSFVYAVMIYETFNRPTFVRWIESNLLFPLGIARSIGPMQVRTDTRIGDRESVRLGAQRLMTLYAAALPSATEKYAIGSGSEMKPAQRALMDRYAKRDAIATASTGFNVRGDYAREVVQIFDYLEALRSVRMNA